MPREKVPKPFIVPAISPPMNKVDDVDGDGDDDDDELVLLIFSFVSFGEGSCTMQEQ